MDPINIRLRRAAEERRAAADGVVAAASAVDATVRFEHRTILKAARTTERLRGEEAEERARARLEARRAALGRLLADEAAALAAEVASTFEPPEAVRARKLAYARELQAENEARRRALAAELEDRRFRESSDALRTRDSAVLGERVALDRLGQLAEKRAAAAAAAATERAGAAAVGAGADAAGDARARVEAEARRRLVAESREVLAAQVGAAAEAAAAERARVQAHEDALKAGWAADAAARAAADAAAADAGRAEGRRVRVQNAALAEQRAAAEAAGACWRGGGGWRRLRVCGGRRCR